MESGIKESWRRRECSCIFDMKIIELYRDNFFPLILIKKYEGMVYIMVELFFFIFNLFVPYNIYYCCFSKRRIAMFFFFLEILMASSDQKQKTIYFFIFSVNINDNKWMTSFPPSLILQLILLSYSLLSIFILNGNSSAITITTMIITVQFLFLLNKW